MAARLPILQRKKKNQPSTLLKPSANPTYHIPAAKMLFNRKTCNSWSQAISAIWEGLGCVVLLKRKVWGVSGL